MDKTKEHFIWALVAFGSLIVGLVLGYLLAMWGVYELLSHIQVDNFIVDLNETKMVEAGIDYMNRTGQLK